MFTIYYSGENQVTNSMYSKIPIWKACARSICVRITA